MFVSVIVDPPLQGRVTVRTTDPVSRSAALALARNVLQLNGATVAKSGGVFKVSGRGAGGQGRGAPTAENIRIMPVRYISAEQARSALQPFSGTGTEITASPEGRYVVLVGAPADLESLAQVLGTLDVDQMRGMSFALLPLQEAGASAVAAELTDVHARRETEPEGAPASTSCRPRF